MSEIIDKDQKLTKKDFTSILSFSIVYDKSRVHKVGNWIFSITGVDVVNENIALNLLVSYLGIAQRRGAFTLEEAAKIYECVQIFQTQVEDAEEVEEEPQDLLKTIQEAAEQQLPDEAPPVSDEEDSDPEEAEPIVEEAEG